MNVGPAQAHLLIFKINFLDIFSKMFTKNDFFCMLARKSTSSKNHENNFIKWNHFREKFERFQYKQWILFLDIDDQGLSTTCYWFMQYFCHFWSTVKCDKCKMLFVKKISWMFTLTFAFSKFHLKVVHVQVNLKSQKPWWYRCRTCKMPSLPNWKKKKYFELTILVTFPSLSVSKYPCVSMRICM